MMPGPTQILIILFVIILLFGAKKLPQLARSLGQSMSEFKKAREESELEERNTASTSETKSSETTRS